MFARYAFLADHVTFDANGKMTAVGIFEVIYAPAFPTKHRDMTLTINLEGTVNEKGKHNVAIELRDDKANRLFSTDLPVELKRPGVTQGSLRVGVVIRLMDIPFPRPGQYEFVVFADDRFLTRVSFAVSKIRVKEAGEQ